MATTTKLILVFHKIKWNWNLRHVSSFDVLILLWLDGVIVPNDGYRTSPHHLWWDSQQLLIQTNRIMTPLVPTLCSIQEITGVSIWFGANNCPLGPTERPSTKVLQIKFCVFFFFFPCYFGRKQNLEICNATQCNSQWRSPGGGKRERERERKQRVVGRLQRFQFVVPCCCYYCCYYYCCCCPCTFFISRPASWRRSRLWVAPSPSAELLNHSFSRGSSCTRWNRD